MVTAVVSEGSILGLETSTCRRLSQKKSYLKKKKGNYGPRQGRTGQKVAPRSSQAKKAPAEFLW